MNPTVCLVLALFSIAKGASGGDADSKGSEAAKLLVSKQIQNKYLVEGMDVVIRYGLYNVGDSVASDIVLTEAGFGSDDFDVAGGQTVVKFNRIPPRSNNSHVLVVRPKKFGYFNFTSAEVRYKSGEEGGVTKIGFSSDPGQGLIIALKDYERQFSAHMLDWVAFAVMTLPSLGIPFLLWHSSKAKYEGIKMSKGE
jgi:translocon-associated protein subunit beta